MIIIVVVAAVLLLLLCGRTASLTICRRGLFNAHIYGKTAASEQSSTHTAGEKLCVRSLARFGHEWRTNPTLALQMLKLFATRTIYGEIIRQ